MINEPVGVCGADRRLISRILPGAFLHVGGCGYLVLLVPFKRADKSCKTDAEVPLKHPNTPGVLVNFTERALLSSRPRKAYAAIRL